MFDAHQVMPGLFLGAVPPEGAPLSENGLDTLVLVSGDGARHFLAVEVLPAGAGDVDAVATEVAARVEDGKNVLVCGDDGAREVTVAALVKLGLTEEHARRFVDSARPSGA